MGQGTIGQPPQVDSAGAAERVNLPATLMMVMAAITILLHLVSLALRILGVGISQFGGGDERVGMLLSGAFGIFFALLGIAFNGLIIYGSLSMKNLENHTLAMVAAILSMLPCGCCCLITLPIGIWSLVVLLDPSVKGAFRQ